MINNLKNKSRNLFRVTKLKFNKILTKLLTLNYTIYSNIIRI